MRNPFKTVYCKDCEHCALNDNYTNLDEQVEFSKCKQRPKDETQRWRLGIGLAPKQYYYCSVIRQADFCFRYKEKK